MAKETYCMAKETYCIAKETYVSALLYHTARAGASGVARYAHMSAQAGRCLPPHTDECARMCVCWCGDARACFRGACGALAGSRPGAPGRAVRPRTYLHARGSPPAVLCRLPHNGFLAAPSQAGADVRAANILSDKRAHATPHMTVLTR